MRLGDLMVTDVEWIGSGSMARHAAAAMERRRIGSVLVKDDGGVPIGIVTDTDVVSRVIAEDRHPWATRVDEVMTSGIVSLDESRPVEEAVDVMAGRNLRHLAVTRQGAVVGMVGARDVLGGVVSTTAPVRRVMTTLLATVPLHATIREAAGRMAEASVGSLLVAGRRVRSRPGQRRTSECEDVAGILTGRDLVCKRVAADRYPYVASVGLLMEPRLRIVEVDSPMSEACALLIGQHVRHLVVTDGADIVGLLSIRDIFRSIGKTRPDLVGEPR